MPLPSGFIPDEEISNENKRVGGLPIGFTPDEPARATNIFQKAKNFLIGPSVSPTQKIANELQGIEPQKGFLQEEGPGLAKRIGPAIVGQTIGSFTPLPIVGPMVGGAIGGGGGEAWAQHGEIAAGKRPGYNLKQIAMQTALGAIPGLPAFKGMSVPAKLAMRTGEGAVMGAGAGAATQFAETGDLPDLKQLGPMAGLGALFGLGGGAAALPFEKKALQAGAVRTMQQAEREVAQKAQQATAQAAIKEIVQPARLNVPALPPPSGKPLLPSGAIPMQGATQPSKTLPRLALPAPKTPLPLAAPSTVYVPPQGFSPTLPPINEFTPTPGLIAQPPGQFTPRQIPPFGETPTLPVQARSPGPFYSPPKDLPPVIQGNSPPPVPAQFRKQAFTSEVPKEMQGESFNRPVPAEDTTFQQMQERSNMPPQAPPKLNPDYAKQVMQLPENLEINETSKINKAAKTMAEEYSQATGKPLAQVEKNFEIPQEKKAGRLAVLGLPTREWLKDIGPVGEEFAKRADNVTYETMGLRGRWLTDTEYAVKQLSDADFSKVTHALEGATDVPENLQPAAQELMQMFDNAKKEIQGSDASFVGRENYWPHRPTPEFKERLMTKQGQESYVDFLRNKGNSEEEIKDILKWATAPEDRIFESGSIKYERKDVLPPDAIRRDKEVLLEYIDQASRHIAERKNYGPDYEEMERLIASAKDASNQENMRRVLENIKKDIGPRTDTDKMLQAVNNVQIVTLMGLTSTLQNMGQRINAFGVKGSSIPRTLRSLTTPYTKEGKQFAKLAGVIDTDTSLSSGRFVDKYLKGIGFKKVERGNRIVSANLGRQLAEDHLKIARATRDPFSMTVLEGLGINAKEALRRGKLTEEELIRAAQKTTGDMNFFSTVMDLPMGMKGGQGTKTMTLFKNAAYQQTNFIKNMVKDAYKNPKNAGLNLIYTVALMEAWGVGQYALRETVVKGNSLSDFKDNFNEDPLAFFLKSASYSPGFGLITDAFSSLDHGADSLAAMVGGPSVGTAAEIAAGTYKGMKGTVNPSQSKRAKPPWRPLQKSLVRRVPVAGPFVAPRVFPSDKK